MAVLKSVVAGFAAMIVAMVLFVAISVFVAMRQMPHAEGSVGFDLRILPSLPMLFVGLVAFAIVAYLVYRRTSRAAS